MIALSLAEHAARIRRKAGHLLSMVAVADLPAGLVVLPMSRPDAAGLATGSGHRLATACGFPPGTVAVQVDAEAGVLTAAQAAEAAVAEAAAAQAAPFAIEQAIEIVRPIFEQIAVHEAAHVLVADLDAAADAEEAQAWIEACHRLPGDGGPVSHGPRWGAAVVILGRRVIDRQHPAERANYGRLVRDDLARYGLDADAIAEALGHVADWVPLRSLLARGGDVARRIEAVCLPVAERQAVIDKRRQHGAADAGFEV